MENKKGILVEEIVNTLEELDVNSSSITERVKKPNKIVKRLVSILIVLILVVITLVILDSIKVKEDPIVEETNELNLAGMGTLEILDMIMSNSWESNSLIYEELDDRGLLTKVDGVDKPLEISDGNGTVSLEFTGTQVTYITFNIFNTKELKESVVKYLKTSVLITEAEKTDEESYYTGYTNLGTSITVSFREANGEMDRLYGKENIKDGVISIDIITVE